jgi:hypothetical protein
VVIVAKKKISANLYTYSRIVFKNNAWCYEDLENNCLFSNMKYPTKITPEDLPEWFIKGRYYKNHGFLSAKGVKDLVYDPNYLFNHFHRDDWLYISYDKPIEEFEEDGWLGKRKVFRDYDESICGNQIIEFLAAVQKYSPDVEIGDIVQELIRKSEWFLKEFPYDAEAMVGQEHIKYIKEKFNLG